MTTLTSVKNQYVLAKLSFGMPQQRTTDRNVKQRAEYDNNAHDALDVQRKLWAKSTMAPFWNIRNMAGEYLRSHTVAFGEYQLLNNALYMKVSRNINDRFFVQWDQERAKFAQDYAASLRRAEVAQGALFDPTIYPDINAIVARFTRVFDVYPVGDALSFATDIEAEVASEVAMQVEETTRRKLRDAVKDPLAKLLNVVMNVHNKTAREDSRIRSTLMTELEELCALMPALNVLGVPKLNDLAAQAKEELLRPTQSLEKGSTTRQQVAEASGAMLTQMGVDLAQNLLETDITERKYASIVAAEAMLAQMDGFI